MSEPKVHLVGHPADTVTACGRPKSEVQKWTTTAAGATCERCLDKSKREDTDGQA
jgi:hypothetical protein